MKKIVYTSLLILTSIHPSFALEEEYTFGHLSLKDGLECGTIQSLMEDHKGFLWIGTESGLSCYDGYGMYVINDNETKQAYQSNINRMQEDASNHIWVSGYNGCFMINPQGNMVDAVPELQKLGLYHDPSFQLYADKNGCLWNFCRDSLYCLDYNTQQITSYAAPQLQSLGVHQTSISDNGDCFYIINGDRLLHFCKKSGNWEEVALPASILQSKENLQVFSFLRCYIDNQGGLWIFSLFNESIAYRPSVDAAWQTISLNKNKGKEQKQNSIRDILEDSEENIWIATDHEGLYLFRRNEGIVSNYHHSRFNSASLGGDNINCLMLDSHNTLWIGHYKTGVSYHNPKFKLVKHYAAEVGEVTALLADKDGSRWIGTDGQGLFHETADHKLCRCELPGTTITSLVKDQDGALWIGTYNRGLYRLVNNKLTRFSNQDKTLPHDNVTRMVIDPQNRLWICSTFGCFYRFDIKTHQYEIIREKGKNDLQGLSICYDPAGKIRLGSVWGLWSNDTETLEGARQFGPSADRNFSEEQFQSLYADDSRKCLWMAHRNGITVWDQQTDSLYELTPGIENSRSQVYSIIPDLEGNIWFNTNEGISVVAQDLYHNKDFNIHSISVAEVQQPQLAFNTFASAVTQEGNLLFGCSEGYCEINPKTVLSLLEKSPEPTFVTVHYNGKFLTEKDLKMWHYSNFPLELSMFSANPLDASSVRYSYRIKGISDVWQNVYGNKANISNLPWGETVEIEVRVCGSDGEWSDSQSIVISTDMPLTRTPLLIAIYILLSAGFVGIIWRFVWIAQRRQNLLKHRQQLHEQQARMNREKLQQMNILFENLQKEQLKAQEYIATLKAQANNEAETTVPHINANDEDFIQKCITVSEKNISDSDFGVEELGQIIGMSRSQLYKRFMAITGKSPLDVIRSVRMKRAKQLFENTHLTCSEIAQLVGYNTLKTFTENFKQEYGMTPSEFQRSLESK